MSLATTTPVKQWTLGLVCAKDMDSRDLLDDLIAPHIAAISHVYTNGANDLVTDWCKANGLPYTVYPIAGGRGLPASTRDILAASAFVYIIATPGSKSAGSAVADCEKAGVKHKVIQYEPVTHWREKVGKVAEILSAMPEGDREATPWAKAAWRAL